MPTEYDESFLGSRSRCNKIAKISQRIFRNSFGEKVVLGDRHHHTFYTLYTFYTAKDF